jgi:hypothetical protein
VVTTLPSAKKVRPLGEVQNETASYWNCDTVIDWFRGWLLPIRASISLEYSQHWAKRQDVTKAIERGRVQARSTAPVEKQSVRAIQPVTE